MKRKEEIQNDGFTLAELLIVVAIIGVLVAIAIPIFSSQLEKSREATDLANVRSKYAELMAEAITNGGDNPLEPVVVPLKQQQDDWQGYDPVVLAGITHYKMDGNTDQWIGVPGPGGSCTITYDATENKVIFNWSGGTGISGRVDATAKDFNAIHRAAQELMQGKTNSQFEIDSKCPGSTLVPGLEGHTSKDNLFRTGTWAYLADPPACRNGENARYFLWTSMDTSKINASGETIPVIVCQRNTDGTDFFYVSTSKTGEREKWINNKKETYYAVSEHKGDAGKLAEAFTSEKNATKYESFEEAYKAYQKKVREEYADHQDWIDDELK